MSQNLSPIFKLQGTIGDRTFVNSKRYKPHTRSKRGTIKEATLNSVFEQNKDLITIVNSQARLIFQPLKSEHHDGGLWSRLVPLFMQEIKAGHNFPLKKLQGLECSKEHKLEALIGVDYSVTVKIVKKQLRVTVNLGQRPTWDKESMIRGYELAVIALFPDFEQGTCRKEVKAAPIVPLDSPLGPVQFELPMPGAKAPYVLLLRVAGSVDRGKTSDQPSLNGLRVVGTSEGDWMERI